MVSFKRINFIIYYGIFEMLFLYETCTQTNLKIILGFCNFFLGRCPLLVAGYISAKTILTNIFHLYNQKLNDST